MKIFLDRGHGDGRLSFDSGATSQTDTLCEAHLVHVVGWYAKWLYDNNPLDKSMAEVIIVPSLDLRSRSSWINANQGAYSPNVTVSLHMNSVVGKDPSIHGTEVLIHDEANREVAAKISSLVATEVLTVDRGVKIRRDLSIIRNTKGPVFLIEMGFISSSPDRVGVGFSGASAIARVFRLLAKEYQKGEA